MAPVSTASRRQTEVNPRLRNLFALSQQLGLDVFGCTDKLPKPSLLGVMD